MVMQERIKFVQYGANVCMCTLPRARSAQLRRTQPAFIIVMSMRLVSEETVSKGNQSMLAHDCNSALRCNLVLPFQKLIVEHALKGKSLEIISMIRTAHTMIICNYVRIQTHSEVYKIPKTCHEVKMQSHLYKTKISATQYLALLARDELQAEPVQCTQTIK